MKSSWTHALIFLSAAVLLCGCGNSDYSLSKRDLAAFKDTAAEMKQAWEQGLKADKANDYVAASTNFRSLLSRPITAEQLIAVQNALGGLNQRMNEAAINGNASAQKALETLREGGPKR